jgi:transposase-like protein
LKRQPTRSKEEHDGREEQPAPSRGLDYLVAKARPDLLKELVSMFVSALMSAEADAICGADWAR